MNKDEEYLLWQLSKLSKNLAEWYDNLLKYDTNSDWDKELLQEVKYEQKQTLRLFNEVDQILNHGKSLDKKELEKLVLTERKIENLEKELERKHQQNNLEMAGNKGLTYIKAIEEFTGFLINYEKIKESSVENDISNIRMDSTFSTKKANYICTYQSDHNKLLKIFEKYYEKSDCFILEGAGVPLDQITLKNLYQNPVDAQRSDKFGHNTYSQLIYENSLKSRKPLFLGDVRGSRAENIDSKLDYMVEELLHAPSQRVAPLVALAAAPAGLVSTSALAAGYLSGTAVLIGIVSTALANKGIKIRELSVIHILDPASARSALIAEKMENTIADTMTQRTGRKPTLFYTYGAAHYDIELYLKYPELRKFVINLHSLGNFPILDEQEVNKLVEFDFSSSEQYFQDRFNGKEFHIEYKKNIYNCNII